VFTQIDPLVISLDGVENQSNTTFTGEYLIHSERRSRWPIGVSLFIYAIIGILAFLPAWSNSPNRTIQFCGCSDEALQTWYLNWGAFALSHLHNPLFTTWGNYPSGVNMMTNTGMPLLAIIAAPITWIFGAVTTYNVLLCLAMPASAATAFFLIRRWTRYDFASFVGGLFFGFSPYVVGQDIGGHLNLAFVPIPPLILLALDEIFIRQHSHPRSWGAFLGILVAAELGISTEIVATMAIMTAIGVMLLGLFNLNKIRKHSRFALQSLACAVPSFLVLAAYPLWMTLAGPQHIVGAPQGIWGLREGRVDLLGALMPTSDQLITLGSLTAKANLFTIGPDENGTYLGVPMLLLLGTIVFFNRRRAIVIFFAVMAIVAWVLSLGVHLTIDNHPTKLALPYAIIAKIPILGGALANRLSMYLMLFAAIVLAVGVDLGIQRFSHSWRTIAIPILVLVFALLPLVPDFPFPGFVPTAVPGYFTSGAERRIPLQGVVLPYPISTPESNYSELWQVESGMRFVMPIGYFIVPGPEQAPQFFSWNLTSSTLLAIYQGHEPAETRSLRQQLLTQWRSWGVGTVLFARLGVKPNQAYQFMRWVLGRPPNAITGGISAWYRIFSPLPSALVPPVGREPRLQKGFRN